jgi:hypothetical protein
MAASYPLSVRPFSTKTNILDVIDAADPNSLQEEVVAIETVLGLNPALSTAPLDGTGFVRTSTQYNTVVARLANIENGIVGDSHAQYVKKSGNETITNANSANVALIIKGAASQSSNLQTWQTSGNVTVASVSASGVVTANSVIAPEVEQAIILGIFGV